MHCTTSCTERMFFGTPTPAARSMAARRESTGSASRTSMRMGWIAGSVNWRNNSGRRPTSHKWFDESTYRSRVDRGCGPCPFLRSVIGQCRRQQGWCSSPSLKPTYRTNNTDIGPSATRSPRSSGFTACSAPGTRMSLTPTCRRTWMLLHTTPPGVLRGSKRSGVIAGTCILRPFARPR